MPTPVPSLSAWPGPCRRPECRSAPRPEIEVEWIEDIAAAPPYGAEAEVEVEWIEDINVATSYEAQAEAKFELIEAANSEDNDCATSLSDGSTGSWLELVPETSDEEGPNEFDSDHGSAKYNRVPTSKHSSQVTTEDADRAYDADEEEDDDKGWTMVDYFDTDGTCQTDSDDSPISPDDKPIEVNNKDASSKNGTVSHDTASSRSRGLVCGMTTDRLLDESQHARK